MRHVMLSFWKWVHTHKRTSQGGGGAAAPPENFFSGKTDKIYVMSKQFSGKMFGQTGFLPPKSGKFFGQKENFFRANRCRPPKFGRARTPMFIPTQWDNGHGIWVSINTLPLYPTQPPTNDKSSLIIIMLLYLCSNF